MQDKCDYIFHHYVSASSCECSVFWNYLF